MTPQTSQNEYDYKRIFQKFANSQTESGHFVSNWNPRMKPFLLKKENNKYIIDPVKTYFHLKDALEVLKQNAILGKKFLFIGTRKQIRSLISNTAIACQSSYVNYRWLGGMLTNWKTIKQSIIQLNKLRNAEKLGEWESLKKTEIIKKKRQKLRLEKYLGGLEKMKSLPDFAIIIGQQEERKAIKECQHLGIKTLTLLDSNNDPYLSDYFIPTNDDSIKALRLILFCFQKAILEGQQVLKQNAKFSEKLQKKNRVQKLASLTFIKNKKNFNTYKKINRIGKPNIQ